MPRAAHTKVWNEDLVAALRAREDLARRQGKQQAHLWCQGRKTLEAVRGDIYAFKNGRVVNLPSQKLKTTVDNLCRNIIAGREPLRPPGYLEHTVGANYENLPVHGNPYLNDIYLKRIKKRSGAYAILLAFHVSPQNAVLTQPQICQTAQHFCDEAMEANYFAGRTYGAFAGMKTLVSHDLVHSQRGAVAYNARAGGLRGEKTRYSLTANGRLFVEALLQTNPEIQREIDAARGHLPHLNHDNNDNAAAAPPNRNPLFASAAHSYRPSPPRNSGQQRTNNNNKPPTQRSLQDERELRQWLAAALPGHMKEFGVGKDRRRRLHDLCDELNAEILRPQGRYLEHASDGPPDDSRKRSLFVTLKQESTSTAASVKKLSPSRRPRSSSEDGDGYRMLDAADADHHRSPAKVARLPPQVAAANAAYERLVMSQTAAATSATTVQPPPPPPHVTPECIDLLDDDSDDKQEEDGKMPAIVNPYRKQQSTTAKPPIVVHLSSSSPEVLDLAADSDSDDDELPESIFAKKNQRPVTAKRNLNLEKDPGLENDSDSDDDSLDLLVAKKKPPPAVKATKSKKVLVFDDTTDSDDDSSDDELPDSILGKKTTASRPTKAVESEVKKETPAATTTTKTNRVKLARTVASTSHSHHQLTIFIDDRERDRNDTPRTLRMELTRLVNTGSLAMVWPQGLARAVVEERKLKSGDFAFETTTTPQTAAAAAGGGGENNYFALPILIERKRMGDLVGRSYGKDHWYQLHRMQEHVRPKSGIAVLMLEGDPRTASQFVAYGAQEVQTISPYDHTIDAEDALYRFFGRAVLADRSTRFVQTNHEQGSLRAVGAFGLMSVTSIGSTDSEVESATGRRVDTTAERNCLKDRLRNAGLPWQISLRIADEMQNIKKLDALYSSIEDETCRDLLLVPLLKDLCGQIKFAGTAHGWSRAVHRLWFSALAEPNSAKGRFDDLCHLVEDHALLLDKLHTGLQPDEALDALLSAQQLLKEDLPRTVHIEVPLEHKDCFPSGDHAEARRSFFRLVTTEKNQTVPVVTMQTMAGPYSSDRLYVHLLDGTAVLKRLQDSFTTGDQEQIALARQVALALKRDLGKKSKRVGDRDVLLIRGMENALNQAAKKSGFRSESKVLGE